MTRIPLTSPITLRGLTVLRPPSRRRALYSRRAEMALAVPCWCRARIELAYSIDGLLKNLVGCGCVQPQFFLSGCKGSLFRH